MAGAGGCVRLTFGATLSNVKHNSPGDGSIPSWLAKRRGERLCQRPDQAFWQVKTRNEIDSTNSMKLSHRLSTCLLAAAVAAGWGNPSQASSLTNGLLCHLTFDNNYNDDSGNQINGTPMGTPTFVSGKIGSGAVSVTTLKDASEIDYVTLGYPPQLQFDGSESFSVSFWTSYTNQVDDPPFISNKNWGSSGNIGWGVFTQSGGNFRVNVTGDGGGSKESTTATPAIRDGLWHHVVVTFDRTSVASIYVDGSLVKTDPLTATTGGIDTLADGYSVNIGQDGTGAYTDNGSAEMVGLLMDDLGIWGRVLSPSEVAAVYQGGLIGSNIVQVVTKLPPTVKTMAPTPGFTGVPGFTTLSATIGDQDTAVVPSTVKLSLDGAAVAPSVNKYTNLTVVSFPITSLLAPASTHSVTLSFNDNNIPANTITTNWTFTVINYFSVPAALALPASAVSTGNPGFQMRVSQISSQDIIQNDGVVIGSLPGCVANAEAQLAGLLVDPMSGLPYAETATPGSLANGANPIPGVLNFSYTGADQGNFTSLNGYPKLTIPGLAGSDENNLAVEFVGYLRLSPGYYHFGINSADGFRVTIGANPYDAFATQVGLYDVRSIPWDTAFDLNVSQDGYYPCRIVWFRESHLANNQGAAGFEFYTIASSGQKVLVNDTTTPGAVLAFQSGPAAAAPYVQYAGPTAFLSSYRGNDFGLPRVQVQIHDGASATVTPASVKLSIDGSAVAATVTNYGGITTVSYVPGGLQLPRTIHTGQISWTAGGTNTTKTWQFNRLRNYVLPAPVYHENFDALADGVLPSGWTQTNYTAPLTAGVSFSDPNSDAYLGWTVINTSDVSQFGAGRLNVGLYQELNGQFFDVNTNALLSNQFFYAESDHRNGQQIQFAYTPAYNLSTNAGVVIAFNSSYEQNQNNICSLEYTIDRGANWLPVVYLLQGANDSQQNAQIIYDANGIVDVARTMAFGISPRYTNSVGKVIGGTVGAFIAAPITQALEPYIDGRVNDDGYESMRFEAFRAPNADNQASVQFRFMQAGTGSWFWGIDNWGVYSVSSLAPSGPGMVTIRLSGPNTVLTWTAGANVQLQQYQALGTGTWANVPGTQGAGTYTGGITNQHVFYRLIRQ